MFIIFHLIIRPSYLIAYLQRLSLILPKAKVKDKHGKNIWVHAVSVGEILSCKPLVSLLQDEGYNVFLSTTTPTGYLSAEKTYKNINLFYFPFDYGFFIKRFLKRIKPLKVILLEMEIWPSFFYTVNKIGIPLYLVSGRLGDKEYKGYMRFNAFFKLVLSFAEGIFMQSDIDKERMLSLSGRKDVKTLGSLKFDVETEDAKYDIEDFLPQSKFILAASTHKGEEELVINAYKNLVSLHPNLRLVIAPRHIHRRGEIENITLKAGFSCGLRSEGKSGDDVNIFIADTIGELMGVYKHADVVIMGGSLLKGVGGHNIIEPALYKRCILCGEYMHNFTDILKRFSDEKGIIMTSRRTIEGDLKRVLSDSELIKKTGENAYNLVLKNKGTAKKIYEAMFS
jgi:3-deoxy-D-manno-octulosonic-acid transferase